MVDSYEVIGYRIDCLVEVNKNKTFLYFQDRQYSFEEMNHTVNRLANGFYDLGIRKGSKVAFMLESNDYFVACLFACMKLGAVVIPINVNHQGIVLSYIINQSEAEYIIYSQPAHERMIAVKHDLPHVKKIITFGSEGLAQDWTIPVFQAEEFLKEAPHHLLFSYPDMMPTDLMEIMYTSGTTGPPKGVIWDQNKFDTSIAQLIGFNSDDTMYTPLPLFHALAQRMLFMCLINGATIALAEKFSARNFWKHIKQYGATWFNYIGAIIPILLKQPPSPLDDQHPSRFAYGCGAPQDASLWKEFENRFNVKLYEYYGTTEEGAITLGNKPGSIGKVIGSHDVKILNEKNEECAPYEIGELVTRVKNPKYSFRGYYKMEVESKEKVLEGGWVKSGDLVYRDEEGYFYFVGRKVESMRRRGENISPWEIESVVNSHPYVLESAAVPVPSEVGEDDVKICVVLKEGYTLTEKELIDYCVGKMANYLIPRYVEFKTSLPKTPTEKIERVKLKNEGITNNTWDRELGRRCVVN